MTYGDFQFESSFITEGGIKVWTNQTPVTLEMMEKAEDFFAIYLFNYDQILIDDTLSILSKCTVEWTSGRIDLGNYPVSQVNGVKVNNEITVRWTGRISSSSLFHEWLHAVLRATHGDGDKNHEDSRWKELIPKMKAKAAEAGL